MPHPTLGATPFSSTVTSHLGIPIAAERTMRWDATGYGMHTEKASPALARTWYFAEGSQGFYDTFFLLTNPTPGPSAVRLRFLLENGTEVIRDDLLLGNSRMTMYAGDIPELVNQAFGAVVTFSVAGGAERAMYFGTPLFNGGHESAGAIRAVAGMVPGRGRDRQLLHDVRADLQSRPGPGARHADLPPGRRAAP